MGHSRRWRVNGWIRTKDIFQWMIDYFSSKAKKGRKGHLMTKQSSGHKGLWIETDVSAQNKMVYRLGQKHFWWWKWKCLEWTSSLLGPETSRPWVWKSFIHLNNSFKYFLSDPGLFLFIGSGTSLTCTAGVIIVNNISNMILSIWRRRSSLE